MGILLNTAPSVMNAWKCLLMCALCSQTDSFFTDKCLVWTTSDDETPNNTLAYITGDPATEVSRNAVINSLTTEEGRGGAVAITHHYQEGKIYFSDEVAVTIYQVTNGSNVTIFHQGFGDITQMAVDWSAWNIYWVDPLYNWIAVKPLRGGSISDFKVLVEFEVVKPQGIAVDPSRGYMYWTESGSVPCLRRATLDGDSWEVIITEGLFAPRSVTIDPLSGRVFWVDRSKDTVEWCTSDGGGRGILRRMRRRLFFGISYYQDRLYVTDEFTEAILTIRDSSGVLDSVLKVGSHGHPKSVTVYAPATQPDIADPCAELGCEHFCLKSLSGGRCLCQDGFTLARNERSCSGSTIYAAKSLVFTNRTHVCFVSVTVVHHGGALSANCPVKDGKNIIAVAPDSNHRLVYFADQSLRRISSVSLRTGTSTIIYNNAGRVQGMTFDWVRNIIYWTDSEAQQIRSYNVSSNVAMVTFQNRDMLGRLTVNPYANRLFWITLSPDSIKTGTPGEAAVKTIASAVEAHPSDIEYDLSSSRILWTDGNNMHTILENGTRTKRLIAPESLTHRGLIAYKRLLIWASYSGQTFLDSIDVDDDTHFWRKTMSTVGEIVDMGVVDASVQKPSRGSCHNNGGCDHHCIPTPNGRTCQCELGYYLQPDRQTCTTGSMDAASLFLTDGLSRRIYGIDLNTGYIIGTSVRGEGVLIGVTVNSKTGKLYWSVYEGHSIRRANLNGTEETVLRDIGDEFAEQLAIDETTGNIYYTAKYYDRYSNNHTNSYVSVISPDGSIHKKLVTGLTNPRAIALHSSEGFMFWSHYGNPPRIERANMDGSERRVIIISDILQPSGIAIDYDTHKLYWTDGEKNVIEHCSFLGMDRIKLLTEPGAWLRGIAIHGDNVYYIGWYLRGIKVANKVDGTSQYLMESPRFGELHNVFALSSTYSVNQACVEANGGCSTLCLPTNSGRTCACQDGTRLQADGLTCDGVALSTSANSSVESELEDKTGGNDSSIIIASVTSVTVVIVVIVIVIAAVIIRKRRRPTTDEAENHIYSTVHEPVTGAAYSSSDRKGLSKGCDSLYLNPIHIGPPSDFLGEASHAPSATTFR